MELVGLEPTTSCMPYDEAARKKRSISRLFAHARVRRSDADCWRLGVILTRLRAGWFERTFCWFVRCVVHHHARGQFVSLAFGQKARDAGIAGIAVSMGSKGDCYDNSVAESFFATIKKELVHRRTWPTKVELRTEIFDYIESFYNRQRRHSTLGQLSPAQFEEDSEDQQQEQLG
jgi:hypothetical protein